jgi:alanine-alpha-ketoisovalerate/valine-pyruvate aminotransferase
MSFEQLQGKSNFSKEPSPCFILMNNLFEKLRTPIEIAIYAHISYANEKQLPIIGEHFDKFISEMCISQKEWKDACEYLMELGFTI